MLASHCIALKCQFLAKDDNAPKVGNGFANFLIHFHNKFQKVSKKKFLTFKCQFTYKIIGI